jgi:hypothetical protein
VQLEVIGAGFGRTGTMSFKTALEALGLGPCYHMIEVYANEGHVDLWSAAIDGGPLDVHTLFGGYRTVCDWPACSFWKEIRAASPGAKVVLTRRDPDAWYTSISNTIFLALDHETDDELLTRWRTKTRKLIFDQTFGNDFGRDNVLAVLRAHEADVIASVPPEQLLVYDVAEGWEPLCAFLDLPVPDQPFPRTNSTAEFRQWTGLDRPERTEQPG